MSEIENIVKKLASTVVEDDKEVSFAGRRMKLDTEGDADEVVQAIKNCPGMTALCLEGNTIGIQAAKAIAKALESQPNFKKALWKDMFTRRTEHEIPEALNFLSSGVMLAGAQLVELDLSDNAFGPRGLKGIVNLLKSPPCYTLRELRLNNNGLGISGAKMLASALSQCLENSRNDGKHLCLKVFVCGRNRLENEGSQELSAFLKDVKSLEYVAMPQNGIYHEGISVLAEAFAANPQLRVLNLEDNSLTEQGASSIAKQLPLLKNLETINLGDCLIRTPGAKAIADSLVTSCPNLKELYLGFNEIEKDGGMAVAQAMENKANLEELVLNGNQFGFDGCQFIRDMMISLGKAERLGSLSEDEGTENESNDEEEDDEENNSEIDDGDEALEHDSSLHRSPLIKEVTARDFLSSPSSEKLVALHQANDDILTELPENSSRSDYLEFFMKVAVAVKPEDEKVEAAAFRYTDDLLSKAFGSVPQGDMWKFNNDFLISLGLIKGEDTKPTSRDVAGAFVMLQHAVKQQYFPSATKDLLQFFLSKPLRYAVAPSKVVYALLQTLYQV